MISPVSPHLLELKPIDDICVKMGDDMLRVEHELGTLFEEAARNDLRETPEVVEPALRELRKMLQDEPDLLVPSDRDEFLIMFLRPCKFYPNSALEKIRSFYKFPQKYPDVYTNFSPFVAEKVLLSNILTILPRRDQEGRRVLIIQTKTWKTSNCNLLDIFRTITLVMEVALEEPRTQIAGGSVIFDLQGLCMGHVMQVTPNRAKMILDWIQDCIPLRIRGIHIVNQSYLFNVAFAIFKPFLREKLRNRIHVHGTDWASLHRHIIGKSLPEAFGGELHFDSLPGQEMFKIVQDMEPYFEEIGKRGYV